MPARILIIGNSDDHLAELKISLEGQGVVVQAEQDGLEGIDKGNEFQPHLLITEILTTGISGFEISSRISRGEAGFSCPVIFYTEFYRDEKARREVTSKYGAIEYFIRPFQKEALRKYVSSFLQENIASEHRLDSPQNLETSREIQGSENILIQSSPSLQDFETPVKTKSQKSKPVQTKKYAKTISRKEAISEAIFHTSPAKDIPEDQAGYNPSLIGASSLSVSQPAPPPRPSLTVTEQSPASPSMDIDKPIKAESASDQGRDFSLTITESSSGGGGTRFKALGIVVFLAVIVLALFLARDRIWQKNNAPDLAKVQELRQESKPPSLSSSSTVVPAAPDQKLQEVAPSAPSESRPSSVQDSAVPQISTKESAPFEKQTSESTTPSRKSATRSRTLLELAISDVSGKGRPPSLKKMKRPAISDEDLKALMDKAVVVRIVVDRAGKVVEASAVKQDASSEAISTAIVNAIQDWKFSSNRARNEETSTKYYSFKAKKVGE